MRLIPKKDFMLWSVSTCSLAFCGLAVHDLIMLNNFGKWDGLWYYLAPTKYLYVLDTIFIVGAMLLFAISFIILAHKYKNSALVTLFAAVPVYIVLLILHVAILYIVH